ncbi:MAG: N-domain protein, SNF2 family, partial [Oscillospiraceae bacterium]|nr:N-domain protein, SNF2 family [Oscillospiraceae bacterium]
VTQDTFDAYLFQTLETKQRFISQIMTSRSPARVCEDVDQSVLDYAEIKALCAGNPLIREKMELDTEISKLQVIKSAFWSEHYKLEDMVLKTIPEQISRYSSAISLMKNDLKTAVKNPFTDNSNENFPSMTINGKVFTDRTQAGKALKYAAVSAINADNESLTKIGEYRGFNLTVTFDHLSQKSLLYIKGHSSYKIELGSSDTGNITKIDNSINNINSLIDENTDSIEQLHFQLTTAKTELKKPFPMEQKLMQMITRQAELTALLNIDNHENAQEEQSISESNEKPSIRKAIADIQKNQNPNLQHSSKSQAFSL